MLRDAAKGTQYLLLAIEAYFLLETLKEQMHYNEIKKAVDNNWGLVIMETTSFSDLFGLQKITHIYYWNDEKKYGNYPYVEVPEQRGY